MSKLPELDDTRVAIIGLGYVGLPLAVEFGKSFATVGFDINDARIEELRAGRDSTLEVSAEELAGALRRLLGDGSFAAHLGEAARERVSERYLPLRHLLDYADLLERALEG